MNIDESLPIEVTRGGFVESLHRVDVAVVRPTGEVIARLGDIDREIFPRSSAKPLQALPLIETGAAERYGLTDAHIALACASHSSQPIHTESVGRWLGELGLNANDLECGPHRARHEATADAMIAAGEPPSRLHNNCSGKHAGFLATALHMGEATRGYIGADHGVQRRVTQTLKEMTGEDLSATGRGADGCGIPVIGMSLKALARGMARMADPTGLGVVREAACRRVFGAMQTHPDLIAGEGRLDTDLIAAVPGVTTKTGAEGVHIAIVPEPGFGIAVKACCGAQRAADAAILWVLDHFGLIDDGARHSLGDWFVQPVDNTLGERVGGVRVGRPA